MRESTFLYKFRDGSIKTFIAVHWRKISQIIIPNIDNCLYNIEDINPFDIGWVLSFLYLGSQTY